MLRNKIKRFEKMIAVSICLFVSTVLMVSCLQNSGNSNGSSGSSSIKSSGSSQNSQSDVSSSTDSSASENSTNDASSSSQSESGEDTPIVIDKPVSISGVSTYYPTRSEQLLNNPGMGWVALEEPTYEGHLDLGWSGDMPEVGNISLSTSWAMIEREDGVYDWSQTDAVINYWTSKGKYINFRICTDNLLLPYTRLGAPEWLSTKYNVPTQTIMESGSINKVHDYLNPIYQQRLGLFLRKLMERYGSNSRIDVVEIRGYGIWGEWHSGYSYDSYDKRIAALQSIVNTWVKEWQGKKLLVVSASYEFKSEITPLVKYPKKYADFLKWSAFDHAMKQPEIAFRRDGIATALVEHDQHLFADVLRSGKRVPNLGEFFGGYYEHRDEVYGYTLTDIMNAMIYKMRPNYSTVLGWVPSAVIDQAKENHWVLDMGNRWFGYRLVVDKAEFNSEIAPGGTLKLDTAWSNDAMGRLWQKYKMKVYLLNDSGKEMLSYIDNSFDPTIALYGNVHNIRSEIKIPSSMAKGTYKIAVALVNEKGIPAIKLGIEGNDGSDRYIIGKVNVKSYPKAAALPKKLSATEMKSYKFESGAAYQISFSYKPGFSLKNYVFGDNTSGYYFKLTTSKGGINSTKGLTEWQDVSGVAGTKTVITKLDAFSDYKADWGSINYGSFTAYDFVVKKVKAVGEDFDDGLINETSPIIPIDFGVTSASSEMKRQIEDNVKEAFRKNYLLDGKDAMVMNIADFDDIDMARTNQDVFKMKPNTNYSLSFKFKALTETRSGGYYYLKLSDEVNGSVNARTIAKWLENPNTPAVNMNIDFRTGDESGFELVFGIRHSGMCSIDSIVLVERAAGSVISGGKMEKVTINKPRVQKITWPVQEGFEEGQFAATPFTMGASNWGRLTHAASELISGKYSLLGRQEYFSEWFEYAHSNPKLIKLKKNTNYEIKFKYKILENGKAGNFYYTTLRSTKGYTDTGAVTDTGFSTWTGTAGSTGIRRYSFNTGNYDDRFVIFGIFNGGAISADDIVITELGAPSAFNGKIDFEGGSLPLSLCNDGRIAGQGAIVTSQSNIVISGKYSVAASAMKGEEWHEFLNTDVGAIPLAKNGTYKVTFKYKILRGTQSDGYILFFARSNIGEVASDVGLKTFTGMPGDTGTIESVFTLKNFDDYTLVWSFHKDAAVAIDDITIVKQ